MEDFKEDLYWLSFCWFVLTLAIIATVSYGVRRLFKVYWLAILVAIIVWFFFAPIGWWFGE